MWKDIQVMKLTENMRILRGQGDAEFASQLLNIGEGREEVFPNVGEDMIKIPENLKFKSNTLPELCKEIFPGMKKIVEDGLKLILTDDDKWAQWMTERAIICPTNADCEEVNQMMMKELPGQPFVYRSFDKVLNQEEAYKFTTEFLNTVALSSIPPHVLVMKRGAPIMLLRNLDPVNGHVNGARYYVKRLTPKIIHAVLAVGPNKGQELLIPRIKFHPEDKTLPFERAQFPVRLCFAITSNKSQGQIHETDKVL